MKKEIERNKAKEIIAETLLNESKCSLIELKIDFPYYDYAREINKFISKREILELPVKTIKQIEKSDWFDIEFDLAFKPIYKLYLIDSFQRVTNQYLENKLKELKIEVKVFGNNELAGKCPCCQYYSIDYGEDGVWDICTVCFWENGGSGLNYMTLEEAQHNFVKIGAMSETALSYIDPEGKLKYKKNVNYQ